MKQEVSDEVKHSLEIAKKEMASLSASKIGYEANQHKRYKELEKKYMKTSNALIHAKAELELKMETQKSTSNLKSRISDNHKAEFHQIKNERDKLLAENKFLKAEVARQKDYTQSLIKNYTKEKQNNLNELSAMSDVLVKSQDKWNRERKKLRDGYKYVQDAWTNTKLKLQNDRAQHEMVKKRAIAERNALQQSMLQAERNAKKYKDKLQIVVARSETEKDVWRNKEMKLVSQLHSETVRVRNLENCVTTSMRERNNALNEVRETRQLELDASTAYQNLLRKAIEVDSEKQQSVFLDDNNEGQYIKLNFNDINIIFNDFPLFLMVSDGFQWFQ